jgi:hypothetical protein
MNEKIRVFLFGGLGNQLFIFYTGQSIARTLNKDVVYDSTDMTLGTQHGSHINSLDFGYSVKIERGKFEKLNQFFLVILRKFSRTPILKGLIKIWPRAYVSTSVGYDPVVKSPKNFRLFYGYFQSWKHLENLSEFKDSRILTAPKVRTPTKWFISKEIEADLSKPIMIHVRLGDHFKFTESFGILGENYFRTAISEARKIYKDNPIWIFSNDLDFVKNILGSIEGETFQYISTPKDSPDVESMMLLAKGVAIVISNSTFSWWSAAFSSPETTVFYPSKWFRNMEDPDDLIPGNWKPIRSDWFELEV